LFCSLAKAVIFSTNPVHSSDFGFTSKKIVLLSGTIAICFIVLLIGFFCGSIYEIEKDKKEKQNELLDIENELIQLKSTTDWNALKNIQVNSIVKGCRRCEPRVSNAFQVLHGRKQSQR